MKHLVKQGKEYLNNLKRDRMENEEIFEEAVANSWWDYEHVEGHLYSTTYRNGFIEGAKWQAEKMYSEEEVLTLFKKYQYDLAQWVLKRERKSDYGLMPIPTEWFEEFKNTKDGK